MLVTFACLNFPPAHVDPLPSIFQRLHPVNSEEGPRESEFSTFLLFPPQPDLIPTGVDAHAKIAAFFAQAGALFRGARYLAAASRAVFFPHYLPSNPAASPPSLSSTPVLTH